MQVGTRLRITLHGSSEDFVIVNSDKPPMYAKSVLNPRRRIRIALVNGNFVLPDAPEASVQVLQALTGNPRVNMTILAKVDTDTLMSLVQRDTSLRRLQQSNEFYFTKIDVDFGEEVMKYKSRDVSAQEFYGVYLDIQIIGADAVLIRDAQNGIVNGVKIALQVGANVNAVNAHGWSALAAATINDHLEVVQELLRAHANVNALGELGSTALILAAQFGRLEIAKELIQAGANVNIADNAGRAALISAVEWNRLEVVKELLAHAANVHAADNHGTTALMQATKTSSLEVVQELLRAHANVNAVDHLGNTALMMAAAYGRLEIAKELLRAGANTNIADNARHTALIFAESNGYKHIADLLREHGAR